MTELSKLGRNNEAQGLEGAVGYWIYNVKDDILNLSEGIKKTLGIESCTELAFSSFKSLVIGADVPKFVRAFNDWINGDTSKVVQIRIVDANNNIRLVQVKGRLRSNIRDNEMVVYGAYIDISFWSN